VTVFGKKDSGRWTWVGETGGQEILVLTREGSAEKEGRVGGEEEMSNNPGAT